MFSIVWLRSKSKCLVIIDIGIVPRLTCPIKGKKFVVSEEASGSGSGKRAGYSAGHKQREETG